MQQFQVGHCLRHGLYFAPDGRRLMVLSGWPTLFDTLGTDPPTTLKPPDGNFAAHAKLARGGSSLVYAFNGHIRVWEYATGNELVIADAARNVNDLAVSPDGATIYVARDVSHGYSHRTVLRAFDATTGEARGNFPACEAGLTWLSMSADGKRLAGRGAYDAGVWDLTAPNDPQAAAITVRVGGLGKYIDGVALSADGSRLATVTSRGLQWWDVGREEVAEVFRSGKHKRRVTAVACSPTKPLLATGDAGGQIFLWDHAGRVLTRFDWGLGEVNALCFAPDGLRCAAADSTGKVVVWDVDA